MRLIAWTRLMGLYWVGNSILLNALVDGLDRAYGPNQECSPRNKPYFLDLSSGKITR